jgi:putative endopeptidase
LDDAAVRPQDDLYRHVNGQWLATAEIPADKPGTGAFLKLRDDAEAAIRDIVTGLSGSPAGGEAWKVEQLYADFMDADAVDALGVEPLAPYLAEIDRIDSVGALLEYFGRSLRRGTGCPLDVEVDSDPDDPSRYVLFVGQSGIGLPDEEYYRLEQHAAIRGRYREHIDEVMTLARVSSSASGVVFDLEAAVAAGHWDKVRTRDLRATHNPMAETEFSREFDWSTLLRAAGIPAQDVVVVAQPSFFEGLAELIVPGRLGDWKLWAKWALATSLAPYLPAAIVQANFDFYGTVLQGTPQLRDRWKRGVGLVEGVLGEAVGKLYVAKHFPPESKARMDGLVGNLLAAYRESISRLTWMTDATRAEALRKLDRFTPKIGYPDQWLDYSALEVEPGDLVGNVVRAAEFHFDDEVSKLGGPIRRHEWLMTPQTVNAYYHPLRNEIVFPAAILQPPFFDPQAGDAVNYGAIGAVIGHEIGHGFDDQGSTCDGDGRLRDWWTPEDRAAFEELTGALIAQYDDLRPQQAPDVHVNGALTIGENIGDLGGLGIAFQAWRLAGDGAEADQAEAREFFFAWARIWRSKKRDEALRTQVATDPHSPEEFRCNQVVKNVDAFHDAFGTAGGDGLWLAPGERVRIW